MLLIICLMFLSNNHRTLTSKNYKLVFYDHFDKDSLNLKNWFPFYLPQWSSKARSKPNYVIKNGLLRLQILEDQQAWCPEFDSHTKCSSFQTGVYSGPLGSDIGQHKFFNNDCKVREEQVNEKKFVAQYGYFEMRAKFTASKNNVVALWLIGYEDKQEHSSELCIMEIKGWNVKKNASVIGMGIHKFNDPNLEETFYEDEFRIDVSKFHRYSAEWLTNKIIFFIDGNPVREINQSSNYPMQIMLGIYELPDVPELGNETIYPKEFIIDYIKVFQKD